MTLITIGVLLLYLGVYAGMGAVIIFVVSLVIRSERKLKEKMCNAFRDNEILEGVITDAALVEARGSKPYRYKYAMIYQDQYGQDRRAFIGIATDKVLSYAVGMKVVLRQFPRTQVPLSDADKNAALNPMRGVGGRLPERIRFTVFQGVPMDETGTLMLEQDYETLMDKLNQSVVKEKKTCKILNIIALILLILGFLGILVFIGSVLSLRSNVNI